MEISCTDGKTTVRNVTTGEMKITGHSKPADAIRELLSEFTSPKIKGLPSFTGGLVGYFSYDYIKYSEPCLSLTHETRKASRTRI